MRELYCTWELLEAGAGPEAAPLHRRHAAWAVVTVRGSGPREFEENLGRARGRMRALLGALAEAGVRGAHAWPRPSAVSAASARYAIGLGSAPPDTAALAALAGRWSADLPGVEVVRADCGAVPTLTVPSLAVPSLAVPTLPGAK